MTPRTRVPYCRMLMALVLAPAVAGLASAQRRGLLSAAPTLDPVVPLGGQRGTTVDLTVSGTNLTDPLAVWASWAAAPGANPNDAEHCPEIIARVVEDYRRA